MRHDLSTLPTLSDLLPLHELSGPVPVPPLPEGPAADLSPELWPEVTVDPGDALIGQRLDGRYTLLGLIGTGRTARMYRALQESTGREVAIKLLREEFLNDEASLGRFGREARAACRVGHPGSVGVHDFAATKGKFGYLAMELVEAETLRTALSCEGDGLMAPSRALLLFLQLADVVAVAHEKGVVHGDLHPGNLFLVRQGLGPGQAGERLRLFDYGAATLLDEDGERAESLEFARLVEQVGYVPPERLRRGAVPGPASDVYAMGAIFFELCTGRPPFVGDDPLQVMAMHLSEPPPALSDCAGDRWFSPALCDLVAAMLAKDPADRPKDGRVVEQQVRALLEWDPLLTDRRRQGTVGLRVVTPVPRARDEGRWHLPPVPEADEDLIEMEFGGPAPAVGTLPTLMIKQRAASQSG